MLHRGEIASEAYFNKGVIRLDTSNMFQEAIDGKVIHVEEMATDPRVLFPDDERSTYSAAAVVLAAEAIEGVSPASRLFADHSFLPPIIDVDPIDTEATVGD